MIWPAIGHARAAGEVPYSVPEVFSAAMRFVRVDRGCEVTDRDPQAAYVTFQCKDEDKLKRGSLEIFPSSKATRIQIQLGDDPHYMEMRWLDLLERKLRDERGTPPPLAPPAKKPPPDGGT